MPRIVDYRVAAIFEIGLYDFDKAFVVMPLEEAQNYLMGDAIGMIEVTKPMPTESRRSWRRSTGRSAAAR